VSAGLWTLHRVLSLSHSGAASLFNLQDSSKWSVQLFCIQDSTTESIGLPITGTPNIGSVELLPPRTPLLGVSIFQSSDSSFRDYRASRIWYRASRGVGLPIFGTPSESVELLASRT
jgi:hypothetical protein